MTIAEIILSLVAGLQFVLLGILFSRSATEWQLDKVRRVAQDAAVTADMLREHTGFVVRRPTFPPDYYDRPRLSLAEKVDKLIEAGGYSLDVTPAKREEVKFVKAKKK